MYTSSKDATSSKVPYYYSSSKKLLALGITIGYQDLPTGHHLRLLSLQKPPEETFGRCRYY